VGGGAGAGGDLRLDAPRLEVLKMKKRGRAQKELIEVEWTKKLSLIDWESIHQLS
jgi:hypothetical protein